MDRAEYQEKLDELSGYVRDRDYESALGLVNEIDWKRVKSVHTLLMVADVYDANHEYDDAKRILKLALNRTSLGRSVLVKLVEVCIKLGEVSDAEEYFDEYTKIAGNDNTRYVLQYKLFKAKRAPLDAQISVLEEYRDREYTERWAYELAALYAKAGDQKKCVETCDDLILWFGEGRYVMKAMELKLRYEPLSSSQRKLYDAQKAKEEANAPAKVKKAAPVDPVEMRDRLQESFDDVVSGMKKEPAPAAEPSAKLDNTIPLDQLHISDLEPDRADTAVIDAAGAAETFVSRPETVKKKETAKEPAEETRVWTDVGINSKKEEAKQDDSFDLDSLLKETAGSFASEIASGDFKAAGKSGRENQAEAMSEGSGSTSGGRETVSEVGETANENKTAETESAAGERKAAAVSEDTGSARTADDGENAPEVEPAPEELLEDEPHREESKKKKWGFHLFHRHDEDEDEEPAEESEKRRNAEADSETSGEAESISSRHEETPSGGLAAGTAAKSAQADKAEDELASFRASIEKAVMENGESAGEGSEKTASAAPAESGNPEGTEIKSAIGDATETAVDKTSDAAGSGEEEARREAERIKAEKERERRSNAFRESIRNAVEREEMQRREKENERSRQRTAAIDPVTGSPVSESGSAGSAYGNRKPKYNEELEIPDPEPTPQEKLSHSRTLDLSKVGENTIPVSLDEIIMNETPEERRIRFLHNEESLRMNDDQRRIFTYFARIPGMDNQILSAMTAVYQHADERTSSHGNLAVMGAQGSGKSKLAQNLILAMCLDLGMEAAKVARITGYQMNSKDPAKVVSKMAGGFLVIEECSEMNDEIVEELGKAMDFRTDRMILIIEDEKAAMRGFLKKHPDFADKIEKVISIPIFTNDELITFARTYAEESNCKIDDMAVLALYTIIGNNQSYEEPMTIARVKSLVDQAITHAKKGQKHRGRGRRGRDSNPRITLREKDFEAN